MKVAVIGAGPAGLMAAYTMAKENIEVDLYEAGPSIGGLAKTTTVLSHQVETGAHFLRKCFFESLLQEMELDIPYSSQERKTFIFYKGHMFDYPPRVADLLHNFNVLKLGLYGMSFLKSRFNRAADQPTTKTFITKQLGARFYSDFFDPYFKKIWGMGGEDLDEIFASSLIGSRNISIIENVKTILKGNNQPKDTYMEVVYPEGGFSALWEEMGKKIRAYRGTIFTSMQIKAIYHSNDGCLIDSDNRRYYDFMISSIAPQTLGKLMQQEVRLNFSYRNIMIVYLSLHVREKINLHCLYIYDEACKIARLTNYSFFERNFQNDILVGLEYWLGDDGMWQYSEADILNQVKKDMDCLPFFKEYEIKQWEVKKFKNAYVVPDLSMQRVADTIHGGLQRHSNLVITGRSQSKNFNYSMEDAMTDGKSAANYVITKKAVTPRQITLMPHGD